jgi:predicted Zn-dependent protease
LFFEKFKDFHRKLLHNLYVIKDILKFSNILNKLFLLYKKMQQDSLLELLCLQGEKWMNINQAREIIGTSQNGLNSVHRVDFYPRQISYTYNEITNIKLIADDGGLITNPDSSTKRNYKLRVEARVGDLDNSLGHGVGHKWCEEDIPFKNIKAMKRVINNLTDSVLKSAFKDYWSYHAALCELDEDKFKKLSEEEPVEYIEEEKQLNFDINSLSKILEEASDYLYKLGEVESSQVAATIQKVNRRFVNLERKANGEIIRGKIFTSKVAAYIDFLVKVMDKNNQIIEYKHRIADLDIKKVLNKESIESAYKFLGEEVKKRLNCEVQESGLFPAIFNGAALGTLVHEGLAAHLLSAKYIDEEHATTFKGKIGKRILPSFISIYNDPTKKGEWGYYEYDEEGVKSRRIELVKDGILMNLLHDRSTAGKIGIKSNGCSRQGKLEDDDSEDKESKGVVTEPRIGILEVKTSNPETFEKLIKKLIAICKRRGLEYGLLVEGATGDVGIETGEFRIYPRMLSRIYTDGRIVPVSSAYILGNPYNMLNDIKALGGKVMVERGFCGSDSGYIYTSEIAPYALISRVEVRQIENDKKKKKLIDTKEQ